MATHSLQYSCLENPVDGRAWWAAVHRVAQSRTRLKQLSMHACIGEGNGNPVQYSCLENPRDREAWWAAIHEVSQSRTRLKWLGSNSSSSIPLDIFVMTIIIFCVFYIPFFFCFFLLLPSVQLRRVFNISFEGILFHLSRLDVHYF